MSAEEKTKNALIKDIEEREEAGAIEPENAALLKKLILNADGAKEALAIAQMGTVYRSTGFYWDKRLAHAEMDDKVRFLKKNEEFSFLQSGLSHRLIIGDNYDALQNLLISHRGKVDVIYIDPPYGKDAMGGYADTDYENAIERDNLLSMLYPRLYLAKELLSETGVIFCSIDDRNQAHVKLLFDEVFEERNFIATCFCLDNLKGKSNDNFISNVGHKILVYTKNRAYLSDCGGFSKVKNIFGVNTEKKYNYRDTKGAFKKESLKKSGQDKSRNSRPYMFFPILVKDKRISLVEKKEYDSIYDEKKASFNDQFVESLKNKYENLGYKFLLPVGTKKEFVRWTNGYKTTAELISNDDVFYENGNIYIKRRPSIKEELLQNETGVCKSFFYNPEYANGTQNLYDIFDKNVFKFPKSIQLIKDLINLCDKKDALILDFFAGSGTTGQAVLNLNREDGGNRTFILCTNNENNIAYGVTAERMKRVMTGEGYHGEKNFPWKEKNKPYGDSFEVFDLAEVSDFSNLFEDIDETAYGEPKLSPEDKISWVCENFEHTEKTLKKEKEEKENDG